jgi:glycine hydroxymethyltransferase
MIPFDPEGPFVTSGIRVGTPAVTTRGMREAEMAQIAAYIGRVIDHIGDDAAIHAVGEDVFRLTRRFPLPQLRTAL